MDTNYVPFIPGADFIVLKAIIAYAQGLLAREASGCSTDVAQQIYSKMSYCVDAEASCGDSKVAANAGINMQKLKEQLSKKEMEEAPGMVELFEANLKMSLPSYLEGMIPDLVDEDQLAQYIMPEIANQFKTVFGGG